ncbi:hypothetical protein BDV33DRAFT_173477 [Aspergillus novoparasiticus]|uniref:Uncharacterized protein n=1 Tax=Aspergillus novoparasiticus TaxID=986946 RepID=A0A5N6EQ41_9EURO|nr:hypothetical protein BDV33DRAFT_173477 [Aspergillus novoparasiticus]
MQYYLWPDLGDVVIETIHEPRKSMLKKALMGVQVARVAIRYVLYPGNLDYALFSEGHDLLMRTISCRKTERCFRCSVHSPIPASCCGLSTCMPALKHNADSIDCLSRRTIDLDRQNLALLFNWILSSLGCPASGLQVCLYIRTTDAVQNG